MSEDVDSKKMIERALVDPDFAPEIKEIGVVLENKDGVLRVNGLNGVCFGELVLIKTGRSEVLGMVMKLDKYEVQVVLLSNDGNLCKVGDEIERLNRAPDVPCGKQLLGRVIDPMGVPLDGKGEIQCDDTMSLEGPAPGLMRRKSVFSPMRTGIKSIDAFVPIGRGQRELIIGDRQTGKTTIAIDTILNQKVYNDDAQDSEKLHCVYVCIGQKKSSLSGIINVLEQHDAMEYTTIVAATAADAASMRFLAPYAGCALGEYFRDHGMHALVIYDDLTKHAESYREMSLLLRRPPGREAYPGDVFYIHSRLLERAAQMSDDAGSGSLTALPIVETQEGDVSAYIPTNVISITDGQIRMDTELFNRGFKPAVAIDKSVSRVGSAAQTKLMKKAAGSIKLQMAQYSEMKAFSQFASDVDAETKVILDKGERISLLLKGERHSPLKEHEIVAVLHLANNEILVDIPTDQMRSVEIEMLRYIADELQSNGTQDSEIPNEIVELVTAFLKFSDKDNKHIDKLSRIWSSLGLITDQD